MNEKRNVLFGMINNMNESYQLYDKGNNLVLEYHDGDILYDHFNIIWKIEKLNNKLYCIKIINGKQVIKQILPNRINILWAADNDTMKKRPFKYIDSYNNILEKFLVYRNIPRRIINYDMSSGNVNRYSLEYTDNTLTNIFIYTRDKRVFKEIVNELKTKEWIS